MFSVRAGSTPALGTILYNEDSVIYSAGAFYERDFNG